MMRLMHPKVILSVDVGGSQKEANVKVTTANAGYKVVSL